MVSVWTPVPRRPWRGSWRDGLSYGALGLPLAFVALPLYVVLPAHYAEQFGVPLAWLGALLLAVRAFDARFLRIWEFYLAYCEAAFDTGNTDVVQFTLQRS